MATTSVEAEGVNTVDWLTTKVRSLAVPVYQRRYRWDTAQCERLLGDIRTVADADPGRAHFIGTILATADPSCRRDLTLIDGQQRLTTLTLLAAAVHHTLRDSEPAVAAELRGVLVHPDDPARPKLVTQRAQQVEVADIVFGRASAILEPGQSALEDNWEYFLEQVEDDAERVWRGLQRLEHVFVRLTEAAHPQQVFESLNATSAPLRNHELVHNYVLMGLPRDEQQRIEDRYWEPIERNTGEFLDAFLRDYLIMTTGRDSQFVGERGVFEVFKQQFPRLTPSELEVQAQEWVDCSAIYRVLLNPSHDSDTELAVQLGFVNAFGTAIYPIAMLAYRDYQRGALDRPAFVTLLEQLQSLWLRRMVVGVTRDHLAAQLCRRLQKSGYPLYDVVRRTPTDDRIRTALRYRSVPHAGYVLQRLQGVATLDGLQVEHIFPQGPGDQWSGDGHYLWAMRTEPERAQLRELLSTIGNLTLLEQPLNGGAGNLPFLEKKHYYAQSSIAATRDLTSQQAWDVAAIQRRTTELTEQFLTVWTRPASSRSDADVEDLVPIPDAVKKPGHYAGWTSEFEYIVFRGQNWEVHDAKTMFKHIFRWLWKNRRTEVLAYSGDRDLITTNPGPNRRWEPLDESHFLFMGLFPQYALAEVQAVLDELGLADEVFVKYNPDTETLE